MNKNKKNNGFGLLEGMLALGAVSALSLGIFMVLKPTSAAATAKREQDNLRELAVAVERSWGLLGGFSGLNASRVVSDELAPRRMVNGSVMQTTWGSMVMVSPHAVGRPDDSFVVVYPHTPSEVCSRLAAAVARDTFDIRVDGISLFEDGSLNPNTAAAQCGGRGASTMEFIFHSGMVAGTAVASPLVFLPVSPADVTAPGVGPTLGPVGPVGPVGSAGGLAPVSVAPVASVAPASVSPPPSAPVVANTPSSVSTPSLSAPANMVAACSVPSNTVENQTLNCPGGQHGRIDESRFAVWTCPEAWDRPVQGAFSGWSSTANTCAPCPDPSTDSASQWISASSACPAGQLGAITWEYEQTRSRSVTYNCPAGTRALPSPTYGGWSGWVNTGSIRNHINTCATQCVAPPPEWRQLFYSAACPVGWVGTSSNWVTGETRAWSCPSPTGSAVATPWLWDGTGGMLVNYGDCVVGCSLPNPSTQVNTEIRVGSQTLGCPSGQSGSIIQTRTEERTQTRTASCPSSTGSHVWGGWSSWSSWNGVTSWTTTSNTCANSCVAPAPESRWLVSSSACPGGGTQSIEYREQRVATCPSPTGSYSWGSWVDTGERRNHVGCPAAPACIAPAPESRWLVSSSACPGGGTQSIEYREQRVATCPSPTGSYSWGSWVDTGERRNHVGCPAAPACTLPSPSTQTGVESRTVTQTLSCPTGQIGNITQTRNEQRTQDRTAFCPAPTGAYSWGNWSSWSGWSATSNWTTVSNTCVAARTWKWVMVDQNNGSCGSQGGGSGGYICVGQGGPTGTYGCGGEVCNASVGGASYVTGYAERWDASWPDCDYQVYECMETN